MSKKNNTARDHIFNFDSAAPTPGDTWQEQAANHYRFRDTPEALDESIWWHYEDLEYRQDHKFMAPYRSARLAAKRLAKAAYEKELHRSTVRLCAELSEVSES